MVQLITIRMTLAQSGDENLVSRAQAKMIVREIQKASDASMVNLDFSGIREIEQGSADQLFRVFASRHPNVTLHPVNCNQVTLRMIAHAKEATR